MLRIKGENILKFFFKKIFLSICNVYYNFTRNILIIKYNIYFSKFTTLQVYSIDDIKLIFLSACTKHYEKTKKFMESLRRQYIFAGYLPLSGVIPGEEHIQQQEIQTNLSNGNCVIWRIYSPLGSKISKKIGCVEINLSNDSKKYVVLNHVSSDQVFASQGLNIEHNASVIKFNDGELEAIWAHHKNRGVIKIC